MKIGNKKILINKNINNVIDDFKILIGDSIFDENKIFYGKIDGNNFIFNCMNKHTNFDVPIFKGEFSSKNDEQTIININIHASIIIAVFNVLLIIYFIYLIVTNWNNKLFIATGFILPIANYSFYLYNLKKMIKYFYLYNEGYYNDYLNGEKRQIKNMAYH
jgi:hypothetical protein